MVLQTSMTLLPLYIITTILFSLQHGETPVYSASLRGHVPVVEVLMKNGADIRICDEVYDFPLNYGLSIVDISVDSYSFNICKLFLAPTV